VSVEVSTDLSGLNAIQKTAKKRQITKKAVGAGARVIAKDVKKRAPRRKGSGALRVSIGTKSQKGRKGKTLAFAVIGARKKVVRVFKGRKTVPANYAHLVEKGTKPHSLLKRAKSKLGRLKRVVRIAAGAGARHPGTKPKPFLAPALEAKKAEAARVMMDVVAKEIAKELSKAASKLR
jgi:HK97 gp10 family phage protein